MQPKIMFYLLVIIQFFYLFVTALNSDPIKFPKDVTSVCDRGTCVNINDCPEALNNLKRNIYPRICYFLHYDQYVCCPTPISDNSQIQTSPLNQSKSDQKCQISALNKKSRREIDYTIFAAVGGTDANLGEFPYMAAIGWVNDDDNEKIDYLCGGVLISDNFVLTAAHCTSLDGKPPQYVRIGDQSLFSHAMPLVISKIFIHPLYKIHQKYNDIALIKLETNLSDSHQKACLWTKYDLSEQNDVTAIGYGDTEFAGSPSDILQKVNLTVISNQQCSKYYKPGLMIANGIIESQICAVDQEGKQDTCQGDSGGPLLFKVSVGRNTISYIVGITSFGQICATGTPSVYTRISSYIDWIESLVWP